MLRTPQGEFDVAVGTTELGAKTPPDGDTHFRIASNTKTMTAALIVLLAQDGKLKFSDPVSAYVPDVPNGENITVARAFEDAQRPVRLHGRPRAFGRHGCRPGEGLDAAGGTGHRVPAPAAVRARHLLRVQQHQLRAAGSDRREGRRAPAGPAVPGPVVRPASGSTQTSLPAADDTVHPGSLLARLHVRRKLSTRSPTTRIPPTCRPPRRPERCNPIDYTNQNSSYATAAGGAISTADDLATWMKALVSGKVFDADYQQQWLASLQAEDPAAPDGQKYGYGISYQRFGPNAAMYYHGGELPGFNSFMGYDPDNDVTLVIWTNLTLSPDGKTTAQAMLAPVLDEIYAGLSLLPRRLRRPRRGKAARAAGFGGSAGAGSCGGVQRRQPGERKHLCTPRIITRELRGDSAHQSRRAVHGLDGYSDRVPRGRAVAWTRMLGRLLLAVAIIFASNGFGIGPRTRPRLSGGS